MDVFFLSHFNATNFRERYSHMFLGKFFMESNWHEQYMTTILALQSNPYMPEEIHRVLGKMWPKYSPFIDRPFGEYYVTLETRHGIEQYEVKYVINPVFPSFEYFYLYINEILAIVNRWLKKHEAGDYGFRENYILE